MGQLLMAMRVTAAVMGTTAEVVVRGPDPGLTEVGVRRLRQLHQRWSRFDDASEVSALNRSPGTPVVVSEDTRVLVERSITAWHQTAGCFDPTVLPALRAWGYDRTFDEIAPTRVDPNSATPAPGCRGIGIDGDAVRMPAGVELDPGGIGKGLAADIVTAELMAAGALGVLVSVGGDIRARGEGPLDGGWTIAVREPAVSAEPLAEVRLVDGALATSTPCRRRWCTDRGEAHHLIDPRTGAPCVDPPVLVSVIGGEAWWAEAATKAFMMGHRPPASAALVCWAGGRIETDGGFEAYCGG